MPRAVLFLHQGHARYRLLHGGSAPEIDFSGGAVGPDLGRRIGAAYMAAPVLDDRARPAYQSFVEETCRQFEFLTGPRGRRGLGVEVVVCAADPYPDAAAMMAEVGSRRFLRVYSTGASDSSHPLLTDDQNDMFRAVHDAFGHAAAGGEFDADGEEKAWRSHLSMYSRLAGWAMTTETRGQFNAMLYSLGGRRFPEQKAFLLPPELARPA